MQLHAAQVTKKCNNLIETGMIYARKKVTLLQMETAKIGGFSPFFPSLLQGLVSPRATAAKPIINLKDEAGGGGVGFL